MSPSKMVLFIQLVFIFNLSGLGESVELCSDNDTNNNKSLLLITFGSGPNQYSNETPSSFNFSTSQKQRFEGDIPDGFFSFVNAIPGSNSGWHGTAQDHTTNDTDGYMYFINVGESNSILFNSNVSNLCIGVWYEFSAYLANADKKEVDGRIQPNVRFEVWATTGKTDLLAQYDTDDILQYDNMTWSKCGLSFSATSPSVSLLMISNADGAFGNNIGVDDIELRVTSPGYSGYSGFCSTDETSTITSIMATTEKQIADKEPTPHFTPQQCSGSTNIGADCDISSNPCDLLKPCQNDGTCNNTLTTHRGYNCSCPIGFNGIDCELDHRPCQPYTCLYRGKCNETSSTTFNCTCDAGWEGINCESRINFCDNVACMNGGICRPLLLNYSCECLSDSYSGRHCEITAKKIIIFQMVSKSFAYIAIIALVIVATFVVIMDILKYCFGIDPVCEERERMRREK